MFFQQGVIHKDEDTFFIEPLWNYTNARNTTNRSSSTSNESNFDSHPHLIVKRSALQHLNSRRKTKDDLGHCGYSGKLACLLVWSLAQLEFYSLLLSADKFLCITTL